MGLGGHATTPIDPTEGSAVWVLHRSRVKPLEKNLKAAVPDVAQWYVPSEGLV